MAASIRSQLARWLGGGSAKPQVQAGVRSPFAFWLGGAGLTVTPQPQLPQINTGGWGAPHYKELKQRERELEERKRRKRIEEEDEELLLLI